MARDGVRLKLAGNAVTVGVARWVGRRLLDPGDWSNASQRPLQSGDAWPHAAWGERGRAFAVEVSMWPERHRYRHLRAVIQDDHKPLTHRATSGFLSRLERGYLRAPDQFRLDLKEHVELTSVSV